LKNILKNMGGAGKKVTFFIKIFKIWRGMPISCKKSKFESFPLYEIKLFYKQKIFLFLQR